MPDYQSLYLHLFNRITDALQEIEKQNFGRTADILRSAQQEAEEMYINDAFLVPLPPPAEIPSSRERPGVLPFPK